MEYLIAAGAALVAAALAFLVARVNGHRALAEARAEHAAELARLRTENAVLTSTRELFDRADQRLRDTFQALASEALKDNRSSFLDLARTSFATYQQPIAETLRKVDQ